MYDNRLIEQGLSSLYSV